MSKSNIFVKQLYYPETIYFSLFTSEELKKLCTTKIITSLTFDTMGNPLTGGLYDRNMGPLSEKSLPCGTCYKNVSSCPGHMGYIELPLPVVNPIFHKTIATIFRLSCLKCWRLQISDYVKPLVPLYMNLLDHGMITEAKEVESILKDAVSNAKGEELKPDVLKRVKKLRKVLRSIGETEDKSILNKTTESLRNKLFQDLTKILTSKKCIHCHQVNNNIQYIRRKIIIQMRISESFKDEKIKALKGTEIKIMMPDESRDHLRKLWINDKELLLELIPVLKRINCSFPTDILFFEILPVPPPICRPVNYVRDSVTEHPQTQIYKSILQESMVIRTVVSIINGKSVDTLPDENKTVFELSVGKTPIEKLHHLWQNLQTHVDCIMDRDVISNRNDNIGLKQILEKKKGIIRMHMMGKRVNFAARSVITPDPNLNIEEIGVPEEFAKQLTYPVPVTSWNVEELRKMVLNGPDVHPGAKMIEFGDGSIIKINNSKIQQQSMLKRLLTPTDFDNDGFRSIKIVHRHLINGDIVVLNRQPTLHKPSIMAHTARILKNEKTIRLHYANCKAYNADFDGDEMNLHFPQSELARSEGYNLVNVSNQYLVPKDGTPLSGLIQDHVVAGVRLSIRGKFFVRYDYHHLVYQALGHKQGDIILLPPSIIKPKLLWSGKQIISTVIINIIPKHREALNLLASAKISDKAWINSTPKEWKYGGIPFKTSNRMTEAEVIIRKGELLCGVLDKTHYGATPYGLTHCIYELYGSQYATRLLSSFSKLFTSFLQQNGFTLGVHDILVQHKADKKRAKIIKECRKIGHMASAAAINLPPDVPENVLLEKLELASVRNPRFRAILDRQYKQALDNFNNQINKTCLPAGLICKFPENNLQLMVQSGAKGSTVNTMQISCLLGQIELEGKRPPVMISGKSLPSFIPFDPQPRAGGFIEGRFMTGILPQEFFFHCMAGREGLIDTAVKTSRSGYLQRCLVKHLEGLKVCYDLTVRDSDNSVIQFLYGEDGMDISKVQFLNERQLKFLADNHKVIVSKSILKELKNDEDYKQVKQHQKKLKEWKREQGDALKIERSSPFYKFSAIVKHKFDVNDRSKVDVETGRSRAVTYMCEAWRKATPEIKQSFIDSCQRCPDPLNAVFQPDHYYGSIPDRLESLLNDALQNEKDNTLNDVLKLKAMQSLAAPGEPVGLLAAQSIGEPSTQMTLNTFHFAGRGEMNVTLGIPRLREILMTASANIKTPSMEIPFKSVENLEYHANELRKKLTKVTVANVLEKVDVYVRLELKPVRCHAYTLKCHFLPHECYKDDYSVTPKKIIKHMTKKFFNLMFFNLKKFSDDSKKAKLINEVIEEKATAKNKNDDDEDDEEEEKDKNVKNENENNNDDSSDEEPEDAEEDAKLGYKHKNKVEAQEPSDEEVDKSDNEELEVKEVKNENKQVNDDEIDVSIIQLNSYVQEYTYDKKELLWCEITFNLPLSFRNLDLTALIKECAEKSVISEVPNIKRAITYVKDNTDLMLRTDGINMAEMFKYIDLLDLNRLYSNDIHKIAESYGIEAARKVIVKEVTDVFKVYGITVDPRHLLLIADYMTFNGTFEPLNRKGMECNASPLQQMSFESSLNFLKNASIKGKADSLTSPSSCLMLGKPCYTGTGSCSLLQKIFL